MLLDRLGHEAAHSLGGILLHLVGDVGIDVQGEACAVVAQNAGDSFGVYALLDGQDREGMTEAVEGDAFGDLCFLEQVFV